MWNVYTKLGQMGEYIKFTDFIQDSDSYAKNSQVKNDIDNIIVLDKIISF
jgi:hypothetical protein